MAGPARPPANNFVAKMRKVYNPIGFGKGYNFVLWFIFSGAMFGFVLARFMYLNYNGVFCKPNAFGASHAIPGECWKYNTEEVYKIGIRLHLYCIIPAGLLVCFQFVPIIRYKVILFHRINGYLVILLSLVGTAGALMIARVSFGGGLDIQTFIGVLAIMFIGSLALAVYNIKRLQIEQHRAWMLRAWFYAGSIITTRPIMFITAAILSTPRMGPYYDAMQCDQVASFYNTRQALLDQYPNCTSPENWVAVRGSMNGGGAINVDAVLHLSFGMALWLSLVLHAVGIEIYLKLTPAEFERLRNISYQRQMEAGFKHPGRAGLTIDRFGDSEEWAPTAFRKQSHQSSDSAESGLKGQSS